MDDINAGHPFREVNIQGVPATARISRAAAPFHPPVMLGPIDATPQFRSVKDAEDADREVGNPAEAHNCPLCNEYFGWEAFKAHAPQCIMARAPRKRVWTPAGMLAAPIAAYGDTVKPPPGASV